MASALAISASALLALGAPRVQHRDAGDAVALELLRAREVAARAFGVCARARELPVRLGQLHLVGARIDQEENLALLDEVPLLEALLLQIAAHAGAHVHRVGRAHVADVLAPVRDRAELGRGHHHLGRRRTAGLLAAPAGEGVRREQQGRDVCAAPRHAELPSRPDAPSKRPRVHSAAPCTIT